MTRRELIDRIHELEKEAEAAGEMVTAVVLLSLLSALEAGNEMELAAFCAEFSRAQIERLTGEPDWSDDTLKV